MRHMVTGALSRKLPPDERKFVVETLPVLAASILLRYDGPLVEKDIGVARLAALQTKALLDEYRALKNGGAP